MGANPETAAERQRLFKDMQIQEAKRGNMLIPKLKRAYNHNMEPLIVEYLRIAIQFKRKFILYCEGNLDSWDFRLYSILYEDALIIPMEDRCLVRHSLYSKNENDFIFAIIDKDDKDQKEIDLLRSKKVFTLATRSIENLFVTDRFLLVILQYWGIKYPKSVIANLKKKAAKDILQKEGIVVPEEDALIEYSPKRIFTFVEDSVDTNFKNGILGTSVIRLLEKIDAKTIRDFLRPYVPKIVYKLSW